MTDRLDILSMSEARFTSLVIADCKRRDLYVFHSGQPKWDIGPGWPDLTIINRYTGDTFFVELKTEIGRVSAAQAAVRQILLRGGHTYHEWRPRHWMDGTIQRTLAHLAREEAA